MSVKRTLPVSLCLLIALSAAANDELFEQAAEAARQGDLVMMQQTYETGVAWQLLRGHRIVSGNPGN
jgi:hypothetical protein